MKEKITSRQAGMLSALFVFSNKILILPSLLSKEMGGDALLFMIMMFALELLVLLCFFALKRRFPKEPLFDIIASKMGKIITYLIFMVFAVYFFVKLFLTYNATYAYLTSQVYRDAGEFIFLVSFFVISAQMIMHEMRSIARTIEFFFFLIIIGLAVSIFVGFTNLEQPLLLFDVSAGIFFLGTFKYLFAFGDFLFLFLIIDKIEMGKSGEKRIFGYSFVAMIMVCLGYFIFLSIYKNTGFMHTNAISDIMSLSYSIFEIGRLDIIAVIVLMFLATFQLTLFLYATVFSFNTCFKPLNKGVCIIFFDVLFIIGYYTFFESLNMVVDFSANIMPYISIFMQYILPIILLFFLIKRRRKKEEKER